MEFCSCVRETKFRIGIAGLEPEQLTGPGDLVTATDYRDVLGEILRKRLNNPRVDTVFPSYVVGELGFAVG